MKVSVTNTVPYKLIQWLAGFAKIYWQSTGFYGQVVQKDCKYCLLHHLHCVTTNAQVLPPYSPSNPRGHNSPSISISRFIWHTCTCASFQGELMFGYGIQWPTCMEVCTESTIQQHATAVFPCLVIWIEIGIILVCWPDFINCRVLGKSWWRWPQGTVYLLNFNGTILTILS